MFVFTHKIALQTLNWIKLFPKLWSFYTWVCNLAAIFQTFSHLKKPLFYIMLISTGFDASCWIRSQPWKLSVLITIQSHPNKSSELKKKLFAIEYNQNSINCISKLSHKDNVMVHSCWNINNCSILHTYNIE